MGIRALRGKDRYRKVGLPESIIASSRKLRKEKWWSKNFLAPPGIKEENWKKPHE